MGWIKKTDPPHICWKPVEAGMTPGDIWECDECKVQWEVTENWGWKRRLEE